MPAKVQQQIQPPFLCVQNDSKSRNTSFLLEAELIVPRSGTAKVLIHVSLLLTAQNNFTPVLHTVLTVGFVHRSCSCVLAPSLAHLNRSQKSRQMLQDNEDDVGCILPKPWNAAVCTEVSIYTALLFKAFLNA